MEGNPIKSPEENLAELARHARAVRKAVDNGQLLVCEATLTELADVLARPKFDRYVTIEDRQQFPRLLGSVAELVPIIYPIRACRDPKDDTFLSSP